MQVIPIQASSILTRSTGYLSTVSSHALNPYRGCALGRSLCGVGCYVRHNPWLTKGREWGSFVEPKVNAPALYLAEYAGEKRWARYKLGQFSIFLASSTEPFQPAERTYRLTALLLKAMIERPPDVLIVQTHSHHVLDALGLLCELKSRCDLRIHISIETDRDGLVNAPPHASSIEKRIAAGAALRAKGVLVAATVAPLLPIADPVGFFGRLSEAFDAVVIDHFIGGDGSPSGARTRRTALPLLMERIDPVSVTLAYRDQMVEVARRYFDHVGIGIDGFAGRYSEGRPIPDTSVRIADCIAQR